MFQIPKLKQYLINKSELIINGDGNPLAKLHTKFLIIILDEPLFGNNQKEKLMLDNDITTFELIAYSISRLVYLY